MTTKAINDVLRAVRLGLMPDASRADDALAEVQAIESMCFWLKGETKQTSEESRAVALLESIARETSEVS